MKPPPSSALPASRSTPSPSSAPTSTSAPQIIIRDLKTIDDLRQLQCEIALGDIAGGADLKSTHGQLLAPMSGHEHDGDRRVLRGNFLIRLVIDAVAGEFLPVASPVAAKAAIAVKDQHRTRTGGRPSDPINGLIPECLLHDFNRRGAQAFCLRQTNLLCGRREACNADS